MNEVLYLATQAINNARPWVPVWMADAPGLWIIASMLNVNVLMALCQDARTWTESNPQS